jgi:hypothetical protein
MLTLDQVVSLAPSVATTTRAPNLSEKYVQFSTLQVLQALEKQGFYPVRAYQAKARDANRRGYMKHRITLRSHDRRLEEGDIIGEISLVNSHDGASAWIFEGGLYRCVCSNQMCVPDSMVASHRVRHTGHTMDDVIEGVFTVVEDLPKVAELSQEMRRIELTPEQQRAFAEAAWALKAPEDKPSSATVAGLLQPRRWADNTNDLWTTMNRVQENLIKGGVRTISESGRRTRTRPITSIDEDRRLNKALFILAEKMKEVLQ